MLSFDTPGPRRRGGCASASLGLSAAGRSVAFSMPDGLIGGRGGKPFKRRISSFSCWFSSRAAASAAFSFSFSSRSRSTSPINRRTSPTSSVGLRPSSESFEPEDIQGLNQASINAPLPPGNLPRLRLQTEFSFAALRRSVNSVSRNPMAPPCPAETICRMRSAVSALLACDLVIGPAFPQPGDNPPAASSCHRRRAAACPAPGARAFHASRAFARASTGFIEKAMCAEFQNMSRTNIEHRWTSMNPPKPPGASAACSPGDSSKRSAKHGARLWAGLPRPARRAPFGVAAKVRP